MKRSLFRGSGHIFGFTLRDTCSSKGWLISTISIALLLLLGIPLILFLVSSITNDDDTPDPDAVQIRQVLVCDETAGEVDYSYLREAGAYPDVIYTAYDSMEAASAALTEPDSMVILRITYGDGTYLLTTYLGDDSEISRSDAFSFCEYAETHFPTALMQKAAIDPTAAAMLSMPISFEVTALQAEGDAAEETDILHELVSMLFPLLMLMVTYMMVLLYGQAVGNAVLLEKTNKLMDMMLTSVHPFAMVFGKLMAVALAGVMQFLIWLVALVGGCIGGIFFTIRMLPDLPETNPAVSLQQLVLESDLFSIPGIFGAILIFTLGFLLYLSIASISGALASKAEDLGKTNYIFVLTLVVSFFLTLNTTNAEGSLLAAASWLDYVPFTAILIMPGKLLLGEVSFATAVISMLLILLTTGLFIYIAATCYRLLVLYRGNPPTPKALFTMLRDAHKAKKSQNL